MNPMIEIVGFGMVVPAVVSIATVCANRQWLPTDLSKRYALAVAFAIAFLSGYFLLPQWAELKPTRHYHWLPWLAIVAAIIGPVSVSSGIWRWERWLLCGLLAVMAACLLVPTWATLQPARAVYLTIVAGYFLLLATGLPPLADRWSPRLLAAVLTMAAIAVALFTAAFVSLVYGRLAGVAAAALTGCSIAGSFRPDSIEWRAMLPVYAILVGGSAFVGCIEPKVPLWGLLVLAAAPLATWLPLLVYSPGKNAIAVTMQIAAVVLAMAAAIGLLYLN